MQSKNIKKIIQKLPDTPGVYFFKRGENILYIGKATSLRDRVKSYMSKGVFDTRGPLISKMLNEFDQISYQKTDSVLEALILEAHLIKKHQPPANILEKDDRSFNHVVITKEDFPRVLVVRGKELQENIIYDISYKFGPFPNGGQLKEAVKIVRRLFPFRDKCVPAPHPAYGHPPLEQGRENHKPQVSRIPSPEQGEGHAKRGVGFRPCFNRQLGFVPEFVPERSQKKNTPKP